MLIWGWGKTTKKVIGNLFIQNCNYCNTRSMWQLCIVRTWFTLFFIPIIPYKTSYRICCKCCNSYVELNYNKYLEIKEELERSKLQNTNSANAGINVDSNNCTNMRDELKYKGKSETQIRFLKAMEEAEQRKRERQRQE